MKFASYGAAGVLAACLLSTSALAYKTGITGYSGKQPSIICSSCHSGGAAPTVAITGPTSLDAGTTGQYTLTITGGPAVVGGTDIAVSNTAAVLATTDSGLQKVGTELTHISPKDFSNGAVSFDFTMTAPSSAGTVVIYGAGNSANDSNNEFGDGIATTRFNVAVTGSSGGTDGGTGSQPDAGTPPGEVDSSNGGGCSSTGGAPVLLFVLAAAGVTLLRRRHG